MNNYLPILFMLTWLVNAELHSQSPHFSVKPAPFSSGIYDEFSPVFYKGGIVFCSNQGDNGFIGYTEENNRLFNILIVNSSKGARWNQPKLLSKDITTEVNEGPVTFSEDGNTIYFTRNNATSRLLRNISDTANKLGIYSAELTGGKWSDIKPFRHNTLKYSLYAPALSADGKRLFFSSDMPGGCGGMDLYYCDRLDRDWDEPVNMGRVINTPGNESFPFASKQGKLYFASDGHPGYGGKDLFYTQEIDGEWLVPVHLDSAINSPADDFGLVVDSTSENGFFSTNRRKTDDIYSYTSAPMEFSNCDSLKENNYCFTFYDERQQLIDTIPVTYQWDFGNGIKRFGAEVRHCFPGSGKYLVKLSIIDELTGQPIADQVDYEVELEDFRQAYIHSCDVGVTGKSILFDGGESHLEGFRITDYFWDFGDGFKPGRSDIHYTFRRQGEYTVKLGLLGEKDSLGNIPKTCVLKKIRIFDGYDEMAFKAETDSTDRYTEIISAKDSVIALGIRVIFMDNVPERYIVKINSELLKPEESVITFDQYGIRASSFLFLDYLIMVLHENPEIGLEIVLHANEKKWQGEKAEISKKWAQELAFYFRGREMNPNLLHIRGLGSSGSVFQSVIPISNNRDGTIEFIFVKN